MERVRNDAFIVSDNTETNAHHAIFNKTVLPLGVSLNPYVNLGTWFLWDTHFVKVFKVSGSVKTEIPFSNMAGINSLDLPAVKRNRFINDVLDVSNPSMVNRIAFLSGINVGDNVEINYYEKTGLSHKIDLAHQYWDFNTNAIYQISGINWGSGTSEITSNVIYPILSTNYGNFTLLSLQDLQNGDATRPFYIRAEYRDFSMVTGFIRLLYPNVLIDKNAPLDFDYSDKNLRLEAYQMPRFQDGGGYSYKRIGNYNFIGYYTHNLFRINNLLFGGGVGLAQRYFTIRFRVRNVETNQISDWMPLRIIVRNRFSPISTVNPSNLSYLVKIRY